MGLLDAPAPPRSAIDLNARRGSHNLKALRPFRAALANRAFSPCNICVIGDSVTEGTSASAGNTSAGLTQRYSARLIEALRRDYPTTGEVLGAAPNFVPILQAGPVPTGWTTTGTWSGQGTYGPNSFAAQSLAPGATATYTIPAGVTSAKIIYVSATATTGFTLTRNGTPQGGTIGAAGSPSKDGYTYTITGAAPGDVIVLTTVGAVNYIGGILLYSGNETAGIRMYNMGHHGIGTGQLVQGGVQATGSVFNWAQTPFGTGPTCGAQTLQTLLPHLVVIALGINDFKGWAQAASDYKSNTLLLIQAIRAQFLTTRPLSILLLGMYDTASPTPGGANATGSTWQDFVNARSAIAAADPYVAQLELSTQMPPVQAAESTNLALYADSLHTGPLGHQWIADTKRNFLVN